MRNEVTIYSNPYPECKTVIYISDVPGPDNTIIFFIYSGACRMQTYATHDEMRALGEMLLRRANANEVLEVAA